MLDGVAVAMLRDRSPDALAIWNLVKSISL